MNVAIGVRLYRLVEEDDREEAFVVQEILASGGISC